MSGPTAVAQLVRQLDKIGVDLPDPLVNGALRVERLHGELNVSTEAPPGLLELDDDALAAAFRSLALSHAIRGDARSLSTPASTAKSALLSGMQSEIASGLCSIADEVIDQLRPAFERAADTVHEATRVGITVRTTHQDVLAADNVAEITAAWRGLPDQVDVLEEIARARVALSTVAGVPPTIDNVPPAVGSPAGALFRRDAPDWAARFEHPWQKWVRLCTGHPARLLSVADSVAAFREAMASERFTLISAADQARMERALRGEPIEVV